MKVMEFYLLTSAPHTRQRVMQAVLDIGKEPIIDWNFPPDPELIAAPARRSSVFHLFAKCPNSRRLIYEAIFGKQILSIIYVWLFLKHNGVQSFQIFPYGLA